MGKLPKYKPKFKKKPGPRTYRGKAVIDATKDLLVNVTDRQALEGSPKDSHACALHLGGMDAARKEYGHVVDVMVHRDIVLVELRDKAIRYRLSAAGRLQTMILDAGGRFAPGQYVFKAVPKSVIDSRGRQHSPPDRKRGDPNSPKARGKGASLRAHYAMYREPFRFDSTNSDYR